MNTKRENIIERGRTGQARLTTIRLTAKAQREEKTMIRNNDKTAIVKAMRDGSFFNPKLEANLLDMNGKKRTSTLEFVVKALNAGGYNFEKGEIVAAEYDGVTITGDVIYTINYKDEIGFDDVDANKETCHVYVKFVDGEWRADF
jgi:hypothetical protein